MTQPQTEGDINMTNIVAQHNEARKGSKVRMVLALKHSADWGSLCFSDIVPVQMAHKFKMSCVCIQCNKPVFPRCGEVNAWHYSHSTIASESPCALESAKGIASFANTKNESDSHMLAKALIVQYLQKLKVQSKCSHCNQIISRQSFQGYTAKEEYGIGSRVVDIAIIDTVTGKVFAVLEIYHSHRTDSVKQFELNQSVGKHVYELRAANVISECLNIMKYKQKFNDLEDIFYRCCDKCESELNVLLTKEDKMDLLQSVYNKHGDQGARLYAEILQQQTQHQNELERQEHERHQQEQYRLQVQIDSEYEKRWQQKRKRQMEIDCERNMHIVQKVYESQIAEEEVLAFFRSCKAHRSMILQKHREYVDNARNLQIDTAERQKIEYECVREKQIEENEQLKRDMKITNQTVSQANRENIRLLEAKEAAHWKRLERQSMFFINRSLKELPI